MSTQPEDATLTAPSYTPTAPVAEERRTVWQKIIQQRTEQRKEALRVFPEAPIGHITWSYIATSAHDVVDVGLSLENFVAELAEDWSELHAGDNVAVWRIDDPMPPRLVAYLTSGPRGEPLIHWL